MTDHRPETPTAQDIRQKHDDELPPPKIIYVLDEADQKETPADDQAFELLPSFATEQSAGYALQKKGTRAFSVTALQDDIILGCITVSHSAPARWYSIDSLTVLPEKQGLGLGTQLVNRALDRLRQLGAAGCTAIGEPHFFSRLGYVEESTPAWTDTLSPPRQIMMFIDSPTAEELTTVDVHLPPDTFS